MFTIVAGLQKKEILLLVKIKEHKEKIIGKDTTKKERSFLVADLIHSFSESFSTEEKALEALCNLEHFFNEKKKTFDALFVYELLHEQHTKLLFEDIEPILLSSSPQEIDTLALKQFFLANPIYFHLDLSSGIITFLSHEEIQKAVQEKEKLEEKQNLEKQAQEQFLLCIKTALEGKAILEYPKTIEIYVNTLKDFAIFQDQSTHKKHAEKILQTLTQYYPKTFSLKGNIYYEAFKVLVLLGVFNEDTNLLLSKYSITETFSDTEEGVALKCEEKFLDTQGRTDLTDLFTFTIDGEETQDFDDALSFEKTTDGFNVYIHISDVSHYVEPYSLLDQTAEKKGRTLYLVDQNILLFPSRLSNEVLALKEGKDSLAISYKISFSSDYQIQEYSIFESIIHVDKNYSYKEMDEFLDKKPNQRLFFIKELLVLSEKLQKDRIEKYKGVDILFSNISPFIKNGKLILKSYNPQENSAFIIRELMILTNCISANFMEQLDFPFVYICQEPPEEEMKLENRYITDKKEFYKLGRFMKKSYMDVQNIGHFALAVQYYTQITSPIRRYMDIVTQRQLKQALKHLSPLYLKEELLEKITLQDTNKSLGNLLENERNKYYLLKYINLNSKDKKLSGMVTKCLSETEYLVELEETQITCKVKNSNKKIGLWDQVDVQIHTVYPRLGLVLGNIL